MEEKNIWISQGTSYIVPVKSIRPDHGRENENILVSMVYLVYLVFLVYLVSMISMAQRASILRPAFLAALSRLRSGRDYEGQVPHIEGRSEIKA